MKDNRIKSASVVETLHNHVSIREFKDKTIDDLLLSSILTSSRRSPTSSNLQAYSLIVVRNDKTKEELAKLAGNQKHIETCDTFIAICADINRLEIACSMHDTNLGKNLENSLVSIVDASLVGMSMSLAAESFGLGTVMIGAMRNRPKEAAKLLNLPKGVFVVFGLCIGWPDWDRVKNHKPRFQENVIVHYESYPEKIKEQDLSSYDEVLFKHYQTEGRKTPEAAWTRIIAKRFNQPRRPDLRETLESLGFSFD